MAGAGSRFRKAGYNLPKYMIEAKGKTLFEWSMDSLTDYMPYAEKFIFAVQRSDDTEQFIRTKCSKYPIKRIQILQIDGLTDGQATTCLSAVKLCSPDAPILIYNIDTYVEPHKMKYSNLCGDGHLICFKAEGTHWSFVKTNSLGNVSEVREKERISDNCSIGAYYFASAELYEELYIEYYSNDNNLVKGEKYIAPMYNILIKCGKRVTMSTIDKKKVHVLGTPEELKEFISE